MTVEHLKPVLESGVDIQHLYNVASGFARGEVPPEVVDALRMGRMTALQKDDGGGSEALSWEMPFGGVVARTIAKQFSKRARQHGSIPVRPFHQGWLRVRDAFDPGCHRHQ